MSDQDEKKDPKESPSNHTVKLEAIKAAKELSNPDSDWTITQEILQDIMAGYIVANPKGKPAVTVMVEDLKKEIESRYTDEPEKKKILLEGIPSVQSIRVWVKKDGWDEAVWQKVRGDKLFSADKRSQVIEALRERAMDKSDVAAKIWLTLSGDYSEKMEVDNKTVDVYREINNIIHRKSRED